MSVIRYVRSPPSSLPQEELQQFSSRAEATGRRSSFSASNLEESLHLLQEVEQVEQTAKTPVTAQPSPPPTAGRWLPQMSSSTSGESEA